MIVREIKEKSSFLSDGEHKCLGPEKLVAMCPGTIRKQIRSKQNEAIIQKKGVFKQLLGIQDLL